MKILTAETNLTSATNISKSPVIRVYNSDSSAITLTRKDNTGTTIGSYSVPPSKVIYCEKSYTDTLEGGAALKVTGVGYSEELDIICLGNGGGSSIVTTNLVLHLDANNYSGSGAWLDETTNNHDGTIDGATYVAASGSDGAYFDFDGSNDHIDFATSSDFAFGTGDYSIGIWFYTTSTKNTQVLVDTRYNSSVNGWSNYIAGSANTYRTWGDTSAGGGGNWFTSNTTYSTNTWYHVVAVRDGTTFKLYTNGTADSNTDTNSFDYQANDFMLGWNYSLQSNKSLEGRIAHVTVYKGKALTSSEVTQNYDHSKSRYGL